MKASAVVGLLCCVFVLLLKEANAAVDFRAIDKKALDSLHIWYDNRGTWNSTNWWNSASVLTAMIDYSIYTKDTNAYTSTITNTFAKNMVFNLEGIDDEGWWGLTWVRAHILTGDSRYITLAEAIFADMRNYWDTTCNGGVWWDRKRSYKNAVTNELFFSLAAGLYLQTNNTTYLDWAKREWAWFEASGMINANHLVNDGLDNCKNNGQTTWTYNQGVLFGGLVDLYKATNNATLLNVALSIAGATFKTLVYPNGVLRESCEPSKNCNGDQSSFKGIFMRHLGYLYSATKDQSIANFILTNANSICNNDLSTQGANTFLGLYWEGPFDRADAARQQSAAEALNAALLLN